ncbi:MAG: hypothetical protein U0797_09700 [Gemmataceae bacterium]
MPTRPCVPSSRAPGELLLDLGGGQRLALHHRPDVADQLGRRLKRRRRVGEHDAVADHPGVGDDVRQHQRRLRDHRLAVRCGSGIGTRTARTRTS